MLSLCGLSIILNAQTNVSCIISSDTTWAIEGSPYIVTDGVLVDTGVTLTIEPGVIVKFDPQVSLNIDGTLIARGTETNQIAFTTNLVGDYWGYIRFRDSSIDATYDVYGDYISGSVLEYCIIEYAGDRSENHYGAIYTVNAFPFINYCTIQNNLSNGIFGYNNTGMLKITNSIIRNNDTGGIGGTAGCGGGILIVGGSAIISNNNIYNNTASNGGGIFINSGDLLTISNNIISNNTALDAGGGISNDNGALTISNNIIINNTASDEGGGINVVSEHVTIMNNIICNNSVSNGNGGGISADFFYVEVNISNNNIINNRALNAPAVSYDIRYDNNFKYNTITRNQATGLSSTYTVYVKEHPLFNYNNIFKNNTTYELWNNNESDIADVDATNNWWGTTSDSIIQLKIHDWFDDSSLGIVDYTPYLSIPDTIAPISPPMIVVKSIVNGDVQLTWNPNPEPDLAGYKIYYGSPTGYSFTSAVDVGTDTSYVLTDITIFDTIAVTAYDNNADNINDQFEGHESWFTNAVVIPTIDFSASSTAICDGDTVFFNDQTIDAGTWSWSFPGGTPDTSNIKNPAIIYETGGTYDVTLIVTNIAGSDTLTITNYIIVDTVEISLSPFDSVCINTPAFTLSGGLPEGGTYSGMGVSDGNFNPAYAGIGTKTITYTIIDTNGCGMASASQVIIVNPQPSVGLLPFSYVCGNDTAFTLIGGSPVGGIYTGNGVTGNIFDPAIAGGGEHTITYTYTDSNACTNSASRNISVHLPDVTLSSIDSICENSTEIVLTGGSPLDGTYSGNGVTGNKFDPAIAGTGNHTITYTYTGIDGCTNSASRDITVNPVPDVTLSIINSFCENSGIIALTGGSPVGGDYSGDWVIGNNYEPGMAGTGEHTITYTYTDSNGCINTATQNISVNPLPVVELALNPSSICNDSEPVELTGGIPENGTYSGTAVSNGLFDPAIAGIGTFSIFYSYTDTNNCSNSDTAQIIVESCTGITKKGDIGSLIRIFPNPNSGIFTIIMENSSYKSKIEIYNIMGKKVYYTQLTSDITVIDLRKEIEGIYFYTVKSYEEIISRGKIIIK